MLNSIRNTLFNPLYLHFCLLLTFLSLGGSCGKFDNPADLSVCLPSLIDDVTFETISDQSIRIKWSMVEGVDSYQLKRLSLNPASTETNNQKNSLWISDRFINFVESESVIHYLSLNDSSLVLIEDQLVFIDSDLRYPFVYRFQITGHVSENLTNTITADYETMFPIIEKFNTEQNDLVTVELSWVLQDLGFSIDGFRISREYSSLRADSKTIRSDSGFAEWIIDASSNSFSDSSCSVKEAYIYSIHGFTVKGEDVFNKGHSKKTSISLSFPEPFNVVLTQIRVSEFALNWSYDDIGQSGFEIWRNINDSNWTLLGTVADTTRALVDNLSPVRELLESLSYRARAYYNDGESTYYSLYEEATYEGELFSVPVISYVQLVNIFTARIDWIYDSLFVVDGFEVSRSFNGSNWISVSDNLISGRTIDDTSEDLIPQNHVFYRIRAVCGNYHSAHSSIPEAIDITFAAPNNLTARVENLDVSLTWRITVPGQDGFIIERKDCSESDYMFLTVTNLLEFSDNVEDLEASDGISYRVKAFYSQYHSDYSHEVQVLIR